MALTDQEIEAIGIRTGDQILLGNHRDGTRMTRKCFYYSHNTESLTITDTLTGPTSVLLLKDWDSVKRCDAKID
ncbi:hypothetical protein [Pseudomonas brassicacearum]|uniref:hypothetical protein n=1 Tax=Pseudomonas brassicacearum TaxID=930166 RepID=UPI001BDEB8BE|nr:hypothetical protein [Pseudomonas brassicacearum]